MSNDFGEEDILNNDIDPLEGIEAIRRQEDSDKAAQHTESEAGEEIPSFDVNTEVKAENVEIEGTEIDLKDQQEQEQEQEEPSTEKEEPVPEPVKRKFKANGQEFEFSEQEMMEQFEGMFGKAIDYTQKMQKIAPFRKMISALEEQNITNQQVDLAISAIKGDKAAFKKLADDSNIDLTELSFDEDSEPYQQKSYGKSETELQISEIESQIKGDAEYSTTVDVIDNKWDAVSRKSISENPSIITGLHHDIKSGVYHKVAPEALKMQMLDGNSKSSLEYYLLAGAKLKKDIETGVTQNAVDDLNKGAQEAQTKFGKESSEAVSKRAAGPTASTAGKKGVTDYLDDDNDENYEIWRKKLDSI